MGFNLLDVFSYIEQSMGVFLGITFLGTFTASVMLAVYSLSRGEDHFPTERFRKVFKIIIISSTMISFIPSHEKIFRLKISKIKNEIVTDDNLKKGAETIEKVIKKLEEKYLK